VTPVDGTVQLAAVAGRCPASTKRIEVDAPLEHPAGEPFPERFLTSEVGEVTSSARRFLVVDIGMWRGVHG
jgi:hypothetical protein